MKKFLLCIIFIMCAKIFSYADVTNWWSEPLVCVQSTIKLKAPSIISPNKKWNFRITMNSKKQKFYFVLVEIYEDEKEVTFEKGTKMMIRTGSGKVYEGYTDREYSNKDKVIKSNVGPAGYVMTKKEYDSFLVAYQFTEEAFVDIMKNGIIKIRQYGGGWNINTKQYEYTKNRYCDFDYNEHLEKNKKKTTTDFTEMFNFLNNLPQFYVEKFNSLYNIPKETPF